MVTGTIRSIEEHPFFAEWSGADLTAILKESEALDFGKGEIVADIGTGKPGCYFIVDGEVSVQARTADGIIEVDRRGAGDTFGEVSMLTGEPFIARIVAMSPCHIQFLSNEAVTRLWGDVPKPLSKLLRTVVRHVAAVGIGFADKAVRKDKMAVVGNVVNDVVSDFKVPAQMIGLGVEAIEMLSADKQVKLVCASIVNQVTKIMEMATELVIFARGETQFKFSRINLHTLMDEFRKANMVYFSKHNLVIEVDVPEIDMDVERLSLLRSFHNLLNNAEFSMEGHTGHVRIVAREMENDRVEIVFSDDGRGIPDALLKNYWEPFITTETGLSMCVVKSVMDCHGGTIEVANQPGGGARVVMVLPRFRVTAA